MVRAAQTFFVALLLLIPVSAAQSVEIKEVTSDKGIKALLVEDYTVPLIAMSFSFKGGSVQDAEGLDGTAELLSTMLDEGAAGRDSQQLQEALDDAGLSYSFNAGPDDFSGSVKTIREDSAAGFALLKEMLNSPRFDEEPLGRMKAGLSNRQRQQETNPRSLAGDGVRELVYGDHPYGRPRSGTLETIEAITADDLRVLHSRILARDNIIIGVVGAISVDELKAMLDDVFGGLPAEAQLNDVPEIAVETGEDSHVELDVPQTVVSFVLPGLKRDDPDFFTAYLVNHIFGGGSFDSRLYEEVREKRGLAYGVGTSLSTRDHSGIVGGGTATRYDRAQTTIEVIEAELKRMAQEGPTEKELEKARAYIKGSYAINNLDTSGKIASVLVAIQDSDLGLDYIDQRAGYIEAVTLEDAKRVARELYSADPTIVTVGRPLQPATD
jgi:zinc protease